MKNIMRLISLLFCLCMTTQAFPNQTANIGDQKVVVDNTEAKEAPAVLRRILEGMVKKFSKKGKGTKNEPHGGNGHYKKKSEKRLEKLKDDQKNAPNKKEKEKIRNKIERIKKIDAKNDKGDTHGRRGKKNKG